MIGRKTWIAAFWLATLSGILAALLSQYLWHVHLRPLLGEDY